MCYSVDLTEVYIASNIFFDHGLLLYTEFDELGCFSQCFSISKRLMPFFFGSLCLIASCAQILLEKASSFSANTLTFNNSKVLNHVVSAPKQVIGPF